MLHFLPPVIFSLFTQQSSHTMVKQITVEELFGSSLPKDPSLPAMPAKSTTTTSCCDLASVYIQSFPTPTLQQPLLPSLVTAQEPGSNQRHKAPGLLPTPYTLHPSPAFQSGVPRSDLQPRCSVSPLMMPPVSSEPRAAPPGPVTPPAAPTAYLGQEILNTLKPADMHKPILAPNFLPSTLVPPHSFHEPIGKPHFQHSTEMDVYSQPPIKPISVSLRVYTAVFC